MLRNALVGLALALLVACGGAQDAAEPGAMTEERAVELARQAAIDEGVEVGDYQLRSVDAADEGGWWVTWELPPPTPPGGHFGVHVSADGQTRVRLGE